jgi:surface protein
MSSFALVDPSSNSIGAFTYQSSDSSVATVSGNTVTIAGIGSATITANQAASGNYAAGSISATFKVHEIKRISNDNGVTYTYKSMRSSFPSGSTNPYFATDVNGAFYAVMSNSQDSIDKMRIYSFSDVGASSQPFNRNGTLVPFNQIVTTFMTNISSIFYAITNFNKPIGSWDTSNVVNMSYLFSSNNFNQPINLWDTSKVTNMEFMFYNSSIFNQPIGNWNTRNVTNMSSMFRNSKFNSDISSWNTANVRDMTETFYQASNFNQPLNSWNTANVTNMSGIFRSASAFDQPLNSWNTANVTNMSDMFRGATIFNQPINYNSTTNSWNTANVTNMSNAFNSAAAFNQPIGSWNTAIVTSMEAMFQGATAFNQDISGWDVAYVTPVPPTNFRDDSLAAANIPPIFRPAPTITFSIASKTFGDESFTLDPSSNSTGAFTFSSNNTTVADISGNMLVIKGAGSANITANQAASDNYKSGSATTTFTVFQTTPTLSNFSIPNKTPNDPPFELTAPTSDSQGSFTYAVTGTAGVADISGNMVTIVGAGSTTITATQAVNGNYTTGNISTTFTVEVPPPPQPPLKVKVYTSTNSEGTFVELGAGVYDNQYLIDNLLYNTTNSVYIKSMDIPSGLAVRAYTSNDATGSFTTYTHNTINNNITDNTILSMRVIET